MGAGGVLVRPHVLQRIQIVLNRYDVLLIADEVITAFGRLGHWFGSDLFGMKPDLITVAKGLTSGYFPLSGCIVSDRVWRVLVEGSSGSPFAHGYTYSAHPLGAAVALTNLDLIEHGGLLDLAGERGSLMQTLLHDAFDEHPIVGEVRGTALIGALEFVAGRTRRRRSTLPQGRRENHRALLELGDHPRAAGGGHDPFSPRS